MVSEQVSEMKMAAAAAAGWGNLLLKGGAGWHNTTQLWEILW